MKENEFIRVFGLDIARMAINECPHEYDLDIAELKRLVESHELVESYEGIDEAKDFISPYSVEQLNKKIYSPVLRIKQAITSVMR